ncbi:MAG TPA: hypothetical protein VEZ44_02225 [bacterium]|nr:hypothetical protein [bacterium]
MRKAFLGVVSLAACAVVLVGICSTASASLGQFQGTWRNTDPNTGGVTALDIRVLGSNMTLAAWGRCHPSDCDWGRVDTNAYGPNVSSNLYATADALSARFRTSFSETMVIVRPGGVDRVVAQVFTRFTDNSGRTPYMSVYTFYRVAGLSSPALPSRSIGAGLNLAAKPQ